MTSRSASLFITVLLAAAGVGSLTAHAQVSARPDPGDPGTPAVSDKPDSGFKGYKSFREQPVRSWKDANQEVADNPGMGSMANMPGMNMPGMGSKDAAAAGGKAERAMPGMAAMPGMNMAGMASKGAAAADGRAERAMPGMGAMPGMNRPGMESKGAAAVGGKAEHAVPGMGAMPGMNMSGMGSKGAAAKASTDGHAPAQGGSMPGMAMPGMGSKPDSAQPASLAGTGVVRGVDKPGARIKLTHDPIAAVSWPQMTIVFRVKTPSLVDHVKQGDKVKFVLTQSSAGYVISDIQSAAGSATNQTK